MMNQFISKVLSFFNQSEKVKLTGIMASTVLMGFIEMISVAAIMPFIAIAVNPGIIETNRYLHSLYHYLNFSSPNRFLLFIGGLVFTLLMFGNLFSAITSWVMIRFCYSKGKSISGQLFKKYLMQPYTFFLHKNSSELSKNILAEVDRFVVGILSNSLQSFSKMIMIISIFTLLVLVKPLLALIVMGTLGSAYYVILRLIRKKLAEALGAIKELKVLGREQKFLNAYQSNANEYARSESLSQLAPMMAKYTIEAIAFGSMLLIALYLIAAKEGITEFMPILALYALSGYRLMPAMQQLFSGYTLFKYHQSAVDILYEQNNLAERSIEFNSQPLPFMKQLELSDVSYQYPQTQNFALSRINIQIPLHATIGIVGASGAGKTTLIDILLGLLSPHGEMMVDGIKITENNLRGWQQNLGYVPQGIFLVDGSIKQNIALGISEQNIDIEAVVKAAKLANLHEFILRELPQGYDSFVGERGVRLSGGQRQRIGVARALYYG